MLRGEGRREGVDCDFAYCLLVYCGRVCHLGLSDYGGIGGESRRLCRLRSFSWTALCQLRKSSLGVGNHCRLSGDKSKTLGITHLDVGDSKAFSRPILILKVGCVEVLGCGSGASTGISTIQGETPEAVCDLSPWAHIAIVEDRVNFECEFRRRVQLGYAIAEHFAAFPLGC